MTPMPAPVFVAAGAGAWSAVQELRAVAGLRLVDSPRRASVLVVAGRVAADHLEALARVHDQMPHPRATVDWPESAAPGDAGGTTAGTVADLGQSVVAAFTRLRQHPEESEPDRLPDEEPNEWRGVGPFGQGGEGMMGGTPYGRPMAMTGDDRDGLALDQLHLRLGPFLPWLPPGMVMDVTMQGEVLQQVVARTAAPASSDPTGWLPDEQVSAVRHELRRLALALHVHGLDALAVRAARLAARLAARPAADDRGVERLCRSIRRSGLLWGVRGVGSLDGLGDASDRWQARLSRLIRLARAGEGPEDSEATDERGDVDDDDLAAALQGMTVTDAVTTVVSLHDRLVRSTEEPAGR